MKNFLFFALVSILCMGNSCEKIITPALPDSSGVTSINKEIKNLTTNNQAALSALDMRYVALSNQASIAAAQVNSARIANTNQPSNLATQVVEKETELALRHLPAPNENAVLEAERRRTAIFTGQIEEAKKLYALAQEETVKIKVENEKLRLQAEILKNKAEASQKSLEESEKRLEQQLKDNQKINQEKLDAANKAVKDAEEKANNEKNTLIFRSLLTVGVSCIIAGIAMIVLTNGTMLAKGIMLVFGGVMSIGIAQTVTHPLFNLSFVIFSLLAILGAIIYFFYEKKDACSKETLNKVVEVLEDSSIENLSFQDNGQHILVKDLLSKKLDEKHKKLIKDIKVKDKINKIKNS